MSRTRPFLALTLGLSLVLAACSSAGGSASPVPALSSVAPSSGASAAASAPASPAASPSTATTPTKLAVGLGYIPSVQFAPFYYADQQGYYKDAGLSVTRCLEGCQLLARSGDGRLELVVSSDGHGRPSTGESPKALPSDVRRIESDANGVRPSSLS